MKYRLFPTKKQITTLTQALDACRWVYNKTLEVRKHAWEQEQHSLSYYDTKRLLPQWKAAHPWLEVAHSQVLQNVTERVDLGFKAFFRRVKAGEEPGYPRFRGCDRYDSLTYPQYGNGCQMTDGTLKLSKVGAVRIKVHRPLEGTPKTCTIRRTSTGKWYATIACDVELQPLPESSQETGLDVGLTSFYTLSDGTPTPCPRFLRHDEKDLKRTQRKLSAASQGTPERARRRKIVARVHERIAHRRTNFTHQESRRLVNQYGLIAVEDLSVNQMVHNHCLAKSILDAAWSQFITHLSYKAAWAGRNYIAVNPAYTSQDCSQCGHRHRLTLSERVYHCPCCGLTLDRDHNAALNIVRLGRQALASA
jgi:putative transposase